MNKKEKELKETLEDLLLVCTLSGADKLNGTMCAMMEKAHRVLNGRGINGI